MERPQNVARVVISEVSAPYERRSLAQNAPRCGPEYAVNVPVLGFRNLWSVKPTDTIGSLRAYQEEVWRCGVAGFVVAASWKQIASRRSAESPILDELGGRHARLLAGSVPSLSVRLECLLQPSLSIKRRYPWDGARVGDV